MSITTKTGDTGETGLFGGRRVKKYDPQVEAYGAVDEATCFIGSAHDVMKDPDIKKLISDIQMNLYVVMAYLADAKLARSSLESHLTTLETEIEELENLLPKLTRFILPQGSEETSRLHIARAMVRSAERRVIAFIDTKKQQTDDDSLVIRYLNRLSDLFFMLARKFSPSETTA
jgi:cob(I)alamin adenosyltransferase